MWGQHILSSLDRLSDVLYACHQENLKTASFLATNYPRVRVVAIDDILNDNTVDMVFIATPAEVFFDIAKKSLLAGKHVFVEKPGAQTVEQINELTTLAQEKKLSFCVGFIYLHHDVYVKLQESIKGNKISSIEMSWNKMGTFKTPIISNLLPHEFSILIDLFGDAQVTSYEAISEHELDVTVSVANIVAHMHINRFSNLKEKKIVIIADNVTYEWNNNVLFENGMQIFSGLNNALDNEIVRALKLHSNDTDLARKVLEIIDKM